MAGVQSRHRRTWPTPFDPKNKQNIRWIEREGHHPRKLVGQIREYLINRGLRRSSPLKAFFKDLDLTVCTLFKATSATKMLLNLRVTDFIVDQPRWHRDRGPATHAAVWTLIGAGTDYVPYGQVNKTAVKKVRRGDVAMLGRQSINAAARPKAPKILQ